MTMTLDIVTQRVEALEKQMAILMADKQPVKPTTKANNKTEKKLKNPKSDADEKPKTKRISGYILYSKATRDEARDNLAADLDDEDVKIKSTDIMKALGKMWKELSDEEREHWNAKATELKEQSHTD